MGRNALILVVGFAIITGVMRLSLHRGERLVSQIAYDRYEDYTARNAAHSGAHLALDSLRYDSDWRAGFTGLSLFNANVDVQVYDEISDPTLGEDTLRIAAQGAIGGDTAEVILTVSLDDIDYLGNIVTCLNANANVNTLGSMTIDGRDHDKFGVVIPNAGNMAVVTTHIYTPGGNTTLSGTSAEGVDLGPFNKHDDWSPIVLQNYVWPEGYPQTPEEVLGGAEYGFPPDFFKMVAQSGYNGSQYVTDPGNLTFPLHGVTYVELPSGEEWNSAPLGENSEGLLIVHNNALDALISNISTVDLFRGLIIADDMMHIIAHSVILGAVFVLKDPLSGNCIGSGTGEVLYSREVLHETIAGTGMNVVNIAILDYWE